MPESEQIIEPPQTHQYRNKTLKVPQLINMLEQMGIGPDIAPIVAEQAVLKSRRRICLD